MAWSIHYAGIQLNHPVSIGNPTDTDGRILVAMTHNTDIQDSWEREGEDTRYFEQFAPDGYSLGVNVLLHAMSH